ncbi:TOM1-like protein 5, partial [Glycine soja]
IIQKASNALEVLKEVLDAVDAQNPQGARDEFTLDLVEQCSFQEQRVMHVVMASRDERIISRAIELNEQLQKVLAKHDDLLAGRVTMTTTRFDHEEEEEEPEQLVQRLLAGRERLVQGPEDEDTETDIPRLGLLRESPLIRPPTLNRVTIPRKWGGSSSSGNSTPPAKHIERERFFQENKDGSNLSGHMRGTSQVEGEFDHDLDTLVHDAFTMHATNESNDTNINMEDGDSRALVNGPSVQQSEDNNNSDKFYEMLREAEQSLYKGGKKLTKLSRQQRIL